MLLTRPLAARRASPADRNAIQALIRHEPYLHTHLDWRPVEDWLGTEPFVVAERGSRMVGALACPPDMPDVAWVRLMAVADGVAPQKVWEVLWPAAQQSLLAQGVQSAAALSLDPWTEPLYQSAGMTRTHDVVVLSRNVWTALPEPNGALLSSVTLRAANPADTAAIMQTDTAAFVSPWQLSPVMIRLAIAQAEYVSVAETDGGIIGYQLATPGQGGVHLARLAVCPQWQGRGLGAALVRDLMAYCSGHGKREITVNTQHNNRASLAVYQKLGFELTGTRLPVYQLELR
ncbi:MAG: GNAT family N-acetyltransferase [Anaerolineales bacterium]